VEEDAAKNVALAELEATTAYVLLRGQVEAKYSSVSYPLIIEAEIL
jgi:hypothetical protein